MAKFLDERGLAKLWNNILNQYTVDSICYPNASSHNAIFRGKDITDYVGTSKFYNAISSGTFDDIFIGDYFYLSCKGVNATLNGSTLSVVETAEELRKFYIADLDRNYYQDDPYITVAQNTLTVHSVVVIPELPLGTAPMKTSMYTTGGYVGSNMYTDVLPVVKNILTGIFGNHLLQYPAKLSNARDDEPFTVYAGWYDTYVNLLTVNEVIEEVYSEPENYGSDFGIMSLFEYAPWLRYCGQSWWLRTLAGAYDYVSLDTSGIPSAQRANTILGIRPKFLLGTPETSEG